MSQLTRDLYVPLVDVNKGSGEYKWCRIDKSTQFELDYGANTEDKSYICYKNDSTEVTSYQPELPQEIVLDSSNELYKFMDEYLNSFPVGQAAKVPFLFVRPSLETDAPTVGLVWDDATIVGDTLNTVDGMLSFNISLNGDPVSGTVSGIGTDTVTFTPDAA